MHKFVCKRSPLCRAWQTSPVKAEPPFKDPALEWLDALEWLVCMLVCVW